MDGKREYVPTQGGRKISETSGTCIACCRSRGIGLENLPGGGTLRRTLWWVWGHSVFSFAGAHLFLQNIKTPEELENEDREAQSAKLQELIRRGTPRDLAAAQELMKTLAGANPDAKPDYRSLSLGELAKLQSKVILLNEMLDNVDGERGERWAMGDAYDQVAAVLKGARPKLQKWVSDAEADDPESLSK